MDLGTKQYIVVGKKAEKTRWDACIELSQLVRKPTIQMSSLMKGMSKEQIEGFCSHVKTFSRPDIEFWCVWKLNKPQ